MPEAAGGEHEVVGEDAALVKDAIAVAVAQLQDAVGLVFELLGDGFIAAGGFGKVEAALVVEAGLDGAFYEGRGGGDFEGVVVREREVAVSQGEFGSA